jgi:uncharacterized protein YicC (UPF0701 family)
MAMNISEKLQEYELRLNNITERAVERGKLEEKIRIYKMIQNRYNKVFVTNADVAKELMSILKELTK